jgi:Mg2+ and Co2+ transporters
VAIRNDEVVETIGEAALAALPDLLHEPAAAIWVDLTSPTPDLALKVGAALDLHPLIVEDVLEGNQRAKIETTDGVIQIVLFNLTYGERVAASELDFVLGQGFLLSVHDAAWDPRATNHLRSGVGPVLRHGPDHLLWALADDIVDGYFPFADRLGDAIDEVQDEVVRSASRETVERVFQLKRELIEVRRAVSPVREVFNQLTNRTSRSSTPTSSSTSATSTTTSSG